MNYVRDLLNRITLDSHESRQYEEAMSAVKHSGSSKEEQDAAYGKVLFSPQYSDAVKRKAVLYMPIFESSRLWGFNYLAGEELYKFVEESLNYYTTDLSWVSLEALVINPAFIDSMGTSFDVPQYVFSGYYLIAEMKCRRTLIKLITSSYRMNHEIAELIISATNSQPALKQRVAEGESDEGPIIEWARKTYNLDENLPDTWVRQMFSGVAS